MCDEIKTWKKQKLLEQILMRKAICKTQNFYILLDLLSITIELLITVSIYCYLRKCKSKQEHSLPFFVASNKLTIQIIKLVINSKM